MFPVMFTAGLLLPVLCPLAAEEPDTVSVEVITIITADDQGRHLKYPSAVFYDKTMEETYLVNGGNGRIVVYGPNFFPVTSIGPGRGAANPLGVYVDANGMLYVCQGRTATTPARITIFNAAFFPVGKISFEDIPGAKDFLPRSLVIGQNGYMYVAGHGTRGVLVFDKERHFSHWLRPMDRIANKEAIESVKNTGKVVKASGVGKGASPDSREKKQVRSVVEDLPAKLIPRSNVKPNEEDDEMGIGPVKVIDVKRDSDGHIYVLSEETSKIYVYSPGEKLLLAFGQKGGSTGKMSRPRSMAVDENKNCVYIADYMRHTILIYDLAGRFMYEFGGLGYGPGWFQYPTSVALNKQGQLIVADLFNQRVQVLDVKFRSRFPLFNQAGGIKSNGPN